MSRNAKVKKQMGQRANWGKKLQKYSCTYRINNYGHT